MKTERKYQERLKTGDRYGMLVAIGRSTLTPTGKQRWEFDCDCGKTCHRLPQNVREAKNPNCGCRTRELTSEAMFRYHQSKNEKPPEVLPVVVPRKRRSRGALSRFR